MFDGAILFERSRRYIIIQTAFDTYTYIYIYISEANFKSTTQLGDVALDAKEAYLPSHKFNAVEDEISRTGRESYIDQVYNPSAPNPPYWKYIDFTVDGTSRIPAK
jgi:hypothetical protein